MKTTRSILLLALLSTATACATGSTSDIKDGVSVNNGNNPPPSYSCRQGDEDDDDRLSVTLWEQPTNVLTLDRADVSTTWQVEATKQEPRGTVRFSCEQASPTFPLGGTVAYVVVEVFDTVARVDISRVDGSTLSTTYNLLRRLNQ